MSIGVPSVATNHGTACNIISQGETGFLVNTEEEWIEAIKNLIGDGDLRYKMGNSARKSVVENYSTKAIERLYLEVLEQL
jgi:glycosyltransferase involved in cell wall biosynthesis